ncbi:hypothetical protein ABK040_002636 [Willaertia magna]
MSTTAANHLNSRMNNNNQNNNYMTTNSKITTKNNNFENNSSRQNNFNNNMNHSTSSRSSPSNDILSLLYPSFINENSNNNQQQQTKQSSNNNDQSATTLLQSLMKSNNSSQINNTNNPTSFTSFSNNNNSNNNNNTSSTIMPNRSNIRQQMNIEVLKRKDKFITSILNTFDHVVLYKYQTKNDEWEKLDVEGTMFIVERNEPNRPTYRFVVMNRKSANDFHQDLTNNLELQVQLPFIFYKSKNQIRGIWFYKNLQCIEFNDLMVELKEKAFGKQHSQQEEGSFMNGSIVGNMNGRGRKASRDSNSSSGSEEEVEQQQQQQVPTYKILAPPPNRNRGILKRNNMNSGNDNTMNEGHNGGNNGEEGNNNNWFINTFGSNLNGSIPIHHHHHVMPPNNNMNEQQQSNDPTNQLKSLLGIGIGADNVSNNNNNQQQEFIGYSEKDLLLNEGIDSSIMNGDVPVLSEEHLLSMLKQDLNDSNSENESNNDQLLDGDIDGKLANQIATTTLDQFQKRKFITKDMFINQLVYTLETNNEFSENIYKAYCDLVGPKK